MRHTFVRMPKARLGKETSGSLVTWVKGQKERASRTRAKDKVSEALLVIGKGTRLGVLQRGALIVDGVVMEWLLVRRTLGVLPPPMNPS